MTAAEVREVMAELHQDGAIISITGDVRREDGVVLAQSAGVHRSGLRFCKAAGPGPVALVRWYETALEWFERSAA